jgi:hypothetical protein
MENSSKFFKILHRIFHLGRSLLTEEEGGERTRRAADPFTLSTINRSEPVFLNVYGAQESIPRN